MKTCCAECERAKAVDEERRKREALAAILYEVVGEMCHMPERPFSLETGRDWLGRLHALKGGKKVKA